MYVCIYVCIYICIYIYVCVCVCVYIYIYIYIYRESSWNLKSSTVEPDRPQHYRPAACVSAQEYSSNSVVSLRFHSRDKQNWRPSQKCYFFSCFNFWNLACLKLHNLKFRKAGNICNGMVQYNPVILAQLHKRIPLRYTGQIVTPSNHGVVKTDSKPWYASTSVYMI